MPATYSTLTALFSAIADAIRARTGGSAAIPAQSFPTAIANIPGGSSPALTPYAANLNTGYLNSGTWFYYGAAATLASDVYRATAGHTYLLGLGSTVGNRFRAAFLASDPTVATANINGTIIGSDTSSPAAYSLKPAFTPGTDGYLVVFKGNDGSGSAATSYALDLSALG